MEHLSQGKANRLDDYLRYHQNMMTIGDVDPAYPALLYVSDRFELNIEQRFWLAWLYALCYHVPTAYYIYNEFPDFENVDVGRLQRWWNENKPKTVFQTDRLWLKSRNQVIPSFKSYHALIYGHPQSGLDIQPAKNPQILTSGHPDGVLDIHTAGAQETVFRTWIDDDPVSSYNRCYEQAMNIDYFGRYALFLYLEAVATLTGVPIIPNDLDLRNSQSSRNGLCYVYGYDEMLCGHDYGRTKLSAAEYAVLDNLFVDLMETVKATETGHVSTIWNVETSLCAFKKVIRGKRYLGYYIDRQHDEIRKAQELVQHGVDWSVLWDFRADYFERRWLKECRI